VFLREGAEHTALKPVFDNLPPTPGPEQTVDGAVNPGDLLPTNKVAYRYGGSLTTPPCSEGVQWIVFVEPMDVSVDQIEAFRALYPANARPSQPLNDREVVEGE
jgi:carbonic anhydrase